MGIADLRGFARFYLRALSVGTILLAAYWAYRYLAGGYDPFHFASSRYFWIATVGGMLTVVASGLLFHAVKAEKRVALTLMAYLFFVILVDFILVFSWGFVGGIGDFFGEGLLHRELREDVLPYAVPAFGLGVVLTLFLYVQGALSEHSQNRFLCRIEPTWQVNLPEIVYWSLLFAWCVLCVGPVGEFLYYKLDDIADALSGENSYANISAGLLLPVALAAALAIRSGASALILVVYILTAALDDVLKLNILPEQPGWKSLIRSPLVLGLSMAAVVYLIRKGTLRPL